MPSKVTKNVWVEDDKVREADKDRAIKEMAKHPGAVIISSGPIPPGLEKVVEQLKMPVVRLDEAHEYPSGKGDPGTSDLLNRIRELTR